MAGNSVFVPGLIKPVPADPNARRHLEEPRATAPSSSSSSRWDAVPAYPGPAPFAGAPQAPATFSAPPQMYPISLPSMTQPPPFLYRPPFPNFAQAPLAPGPSKPKLPGYIVSISKPKGSITAGFDPGRKPRSEKEELFPPGKVSDLDQLILSDESGANKFLIGLEYIIEIQHNTLKFMQNTYVCLLCNQTVKSNKVDITTTVNNIYSHIKGSSHKIVYLRKYFPRTTEKLIGKMKPVPQTAVNPIIMKILEKFVQMKVKIVVGQKLYKKHAVEIKAMIEQSSHFSENDEFVSEICGPESETNNIEDGKNSKLTRSPSNEKSRSRSRSKSERSKPTRSPHKRRSRSNDRKRERKRSRSRSNDRKRERKRSRSRSNDWKRERKHTRSRSNDRKRERKHSRSRSNDRRERVRSRSKERRSAERISKSIRSKSQTSRSSKSPTRSQTELETRVREFLDLDRILWREIEAERDQFRREPEDHPDYSEEWRHFYKDKCAKLGRLVEPVFLKVDWAKKWDEYLSNYLDNKLNYRRKEITQRLHITTEDIQSYIKRQKSESSSARPTSPFNTEIKNDRRDYQKETSNDEVSVIKTLRLMSAIEHLLGDLGIQVVQSLGKANILESSGGPGESLFMIHDLRFFKLLHQCKLMLKGKLLDLSIPKKGLNVVRNCIDQITILMQQSRCELSPPPKVDPDARLKEVLAKTIEEEYERNGLPINQEQIIKLVESELVRIKAGVQQASQPVSVPPKATTVVKQEPTDWSLGHDNRPHSDTHQHQSNSNSDDLRYPSNQRPNDQPYPSNHLLDNRQFPSNPLPDYRQYPSNHRLDEPHFPSRQYPNNAQPEGPQHSSYHQPNQQLLPSASQIKQERMETFEAESAQVKIKQEVFDNYQTEADSNQEDKEEFEDLTLEELVALFKNFKELEKEIQQPLIMYMKRLERTDPDKVTMLKERINGIM